MKSCILDNSINIVFEVLKSHRIPCKETITYANVFAPFHKHSLSVILQRKVVEVRRTGWRIAMGVDC